MSAPPNPVGMTLPDYIAAVRADWIARGIACDGGHIAVSVWHFLVANNPPTSEEEEVRAHMAAAMALYSLTPSAGIIESERRPYDDRAALFITDCRRALTNFLARKRYAVKRAHAALLAANTK